MRQYRIHPLSLGVAATLCAALAGEAAAQSPQRIGIVVTTAVNVSAEEADSLTATLGHALEEDLGVVVTAGPETRRRLPLEGLPDGCVADAVCRRDLGQRLDADELLMVVLARVGNRVQIDTTWVDVATGKVASRPVLVLNAGAESTVVFHDAGSNLLPHIERAQPAAAQAPAASPGPAAPVTSAPAVRARSERRMTTGVWLAAGAGAVALAGGATLGVLSMRDYAALDESGCRDTGSCDSAAVDRLELQGRAADVLFGVSAVAGATALVLYVLSDGAGEAPAAGAARIGPAARPLVGIGAGPDHVQIRVGGRF